MFGNDDEFVSTFKRELNDTYSIDDMGQVNVILGIKVVRDRVANTLTISQTKYIDKITKHITKSGAVKTPITKANYNSAVDINHTNARSLGPDVPYRNNIGGALYCCICTRPDVAFTVSTLASFNSNPKIMHWRALQELLKFLSLTKDTGITYGLPDGDMLPNQLYLFVDADWGNERVDKSARIGRRSRSGYVIYLNGGPVCWHSAYQSRVAQSTSEAELYALVEAVNELNMLRNLLIEIGEPQQTSQVFEDNKGVIDWANNQRSSSRLKKLEIADYVVREYGDNNICAYVHVVTGKQRADILTKVMDPKPFNSGFNMLYNISNG